MQTQFIRLLRPSLAVALAFAVAACGSAPTSIAHGARSAACVPASQLLVSRRLGQLYLNCLLKEKMET